MKEIFEENWCCLQCGQCKYFKVNADMEGVESTCKRLDHKHLKFAKPWFKSYDCGQFVGRVCKEFEPADYCVWLKKHWVSYDDYHQDDIIGDDAKSYFCLDNDFSVRYGVLTKDFVDGTMFDDNGDLKWVEKVYYKRSKSSPIGYELVHEVRKKSKG